MQITLTSTVVRALGFIFAVVVLSVATASDAIGQSSRPPNRNQPGIERIVPNPLPDGKEAVIQFKLPATGAFSLKIYALDGSLIKSLLDEESTTSELRAINWDGRGADGSLVSNGMYFCCLVMGKFVVSKQVIIQR